MVNYGTTAMYYDMVVPWYGIPWYTMVTPWCTMFYHGKLWYDRDVLRHGCTMVYHGMV